MTAQERAEKLIQKWMNASPDKNGLNLVSGVWDKDIAAELEAYAEEGRRAGLEEAAKWLESGGHLDGNLNGYAKYIRALITHAAGTPEANEGEPK